MSRSNSNSNCCDRSWLLWLLWLLSLLWCCGCCGCCGAVVALVRCGCCGLCCCVCCGCCGGCLLWIQNSTPPWSLQPTPSLSIHQGTIVIVSLLSLSLCHCCCSRVPLVFPRLGGSVVGIQLGKHESTSIPPCRHLRACQVPSYENSLQGLLWCTQCRKGRF